MSVGIVIAATTPIIPKVTKTSASVKAFSTYSYPPCANYSTRLKICKFFKKNFYSGKMYSQSKIRLGMSNALILNSESGGRINVEFTPLSDSA